MKKSFAWCIVAITVIFTLTLLKYPGLQPLLNFLCGLFLLLAFAFLLIFGGLAFIEGFMKETESEVLPAEYECCCDNDADNVEA